MSADSDHPIRQPIISQAIPGHIDVWHGCILIIVPIRWPGDFIRYAIPALSTAKDLLMNKSLPLICASALLSQALPLLVIAEEPQEAWSLEKVVTLESVGNLEGGIRTGWRHLSNLDLIATVDTGAAGWWQNGEWNAYVLGVYGGEPGELTGDLQTLSNIEADDALRLYEFWYRHRFADGRVQVLSGLHDYNSAFYSLQAADLFSHAAFGIGTEASQATPSIFPVTALAFMLAIEGDEHYLRLAAYDGKPGHPDRTTGTHIRFDDGDGIFYAAEWGAAVAGRYAFGLGGWWHTAEVENPVNGSPSDSNQGAYLIGEVTLYEQMQLFIQAGQARPGKNQISDYFGAGIRLNNQWTEGDGLGLAVAQARNSSAFLDANTGLDAAETAWELTYQYPWQRITLQSSLYYVQNPVPIPV